MATADEYAAWIVKNEHLKGTPDFDTVAAAYQEAKAQESAPPPAADTPPWQDQFAPANLKRQAGLAARYGVEGLASIPGIFINPWQNLAKNTSERITGEPSSIKTFSGATSDLLTRLGLPTEQTDTEHLSGAISRAIASGGGSIAAARAAPGLISAAPEVLPLLRGGTRVPQPPLPTIPGATAVPRTPLPTVPGATIMPRMAPTNPFAAQPVAQAVQAGIGAGAGEWTRQAGGGFGAQLLASMAAPLGFNTAVNATKAAGRGVKEAVRPLTAGGAQQIAADVVGSVASDKTTAAQRIEEWLAQRQRNLSGVRGSLPTAGAASKDYGLIQGEQLAVRGPANPEFASRFAANNEARVDALSNLNATEQQIAAYKARRDAATAPLREQAFARATKPVDYDEVLKTLDRIAASPPGGRVQSEKALEFINARVTKYLQEGRLHPEDAYGLYKDIGEMVKGTLVHEGAPLRLAAGLAIDVQKELGRQIEKSAPGFQKYLEKYHRLSNPIDRLEEVTKHLGGENLTGVTSSMPQVGPSGIPQYTVSQPKVRNAISNLDKTLPVNPKGLPLAPHQREVMQRVLDDLNEAAIAARGGKPPGSDTYQNMATSNLLSSIFGKQLANAGVMKPVTSTVNFAYSKTGLEKRIEDMITQAYLDPKKMAELLRIARTRRSFSGADLETMANRNIYGGLLGGAAGGSP